MTVKKKWLLGVSGFVIAGVVAIAIGTIVFMAVALVSDVREDMRSNQEAILASIQSIREEIRSLDSRVQTVEIQRGFASDRQHTQTAHFGEVERGFRRS